MKKRKNYEPMPVNTAVLFIIVGLLLGSIFSFGTKYWNAPIEREDALYVEATFEEIKIRGRNGRRGAVIRFVDHDHLSIDSSCLSNDLINDLKNLQRGDRVTLLVHPNSSTILEMKTGGQILMRFDYSMEMLGSTEYLFVIIGIFMYFCAAFGAGTLIMRYIKARKPKKQG